MLPPRVPKVGCHTFTELVKVDTVLVFGDWEPKPVGSNVELVASLFAGSAVPHLLVEVNPCRRVGVNVPWNGAGDSDTFALGTTNDWDHLSTPSSIRLDNVDAIKCRVDL